MKILPSHACSIGFHCKESLPDYQALVSTYLSLLYIVPHIHTNFFRLFPSLDSVLFGVFFEDVNQEKVGLVTMHLPKIVLLRRYRNLWGTTRPGWHASQRCNRIDALFVSTFDVPLELTDSSISNLLVSHKEEKKREICDLQGCDGRIN
jgi:hypothetical protein